MIPDPSDREAFIAWSREQNAAALARFAAWQEAIGRPLPKRRSRNRMKPAPGEIDAIEEENG